MGNSSQRQHDDSSASTLARTDNVVATPADSMLSASANNNHSLFSFGRNGRAGDSEDMSRPYELFLPSANFDDLHTSIDSAASESNLSQFPTPTGEGAIPEAHGVSGVPAEKPSATVDAPTTRVAHPPVSRPTRAGSILRRSSLTKPLAPSTASAASTTAGSLTGPAAPGNRRGTNHYPPVSSLSLAKQPRKPISSGGAMETDLRAQRRRLSLIDASARDQALPDATRSIGDDVDTSDGTTGPKSTQPPQRLRDPNTTASSLRSESAQTQGQPHLVPPRSPAAANKRFSALHGLGARTRSPTDLTIRANRKSIISHSQSASQLGSVTLSRPSPGPATRDASRSPPTVPQKSATPSSSRTTPDPSAARKSHMAGLSVSNTSGSRTSVSTPRGPPASSASTSRLATPKPLGLHLTISNEDEEEDVPPVPTIPTNYQSPKMSPAEFEKRKTLLEMSSGNSNATTYGTSMVDIPMPRRRGSVRKSYIPSKETDKALPRKNLQPLKLPPINLAPLNAATTARIDEIKRQGAAAALRDETPPPSRAPPKTPTTPLTASKSTFFSRHRHDDRELRHPRSNSSIHQARFETPSVADGATTSSESVAPSIDLARKSSFSPFLSSSVPKTSIELPSSMIKRARTEGDAQNTAGLARERELSSFKSVASRGPAQTVRRIVSPVSKPLSSPEDPQTPSSMATLRRKLSLSGWKRNASKSNIAVPQANPPHELLTHQQPVAEPQKTLPAQSTQSIESIKPASPTPSVKKPYLEFRRRKSSTSSLGTAQTNGAHKSETWSNGDSPKKDQAAGSAAERPSLFRNASVVQMIKRGKSSTATIRGPEIYVADVDGDDRAAEEEMRRLGARRKETETAGRMLDALRKRATPKERVSAQEARRIAMLNAYERGEIIDCPDVYFCGTQHAQKVVGNAQANVANYGYDDARGDYTIVAGDHLVYRYEIVDILGKGSFGQVVRCIDHKTGALVAVKIIRNKKRFHQQALVEVNILNKIRDWDSNNRHSMVNFSDSFYFRGHLCISTELLDMNLYEFIKAHGFRGFSLRIIRRFCKQMLSSLCLLKHQKVIHCDLKPENILLRHPLHSEIKVIDFGSSCFENEKVYTYIQSRFYRSPEVILGMTYGLPIDMWSLGCILAELYTGVPIFPGENEQEQLACIMEIFGPPEKHLIEKSTRKKLFFDSMGKPRLTVSSKGRRRRPSSKTLQQVLKCDDEPFLDFLTRCLRWDPDRRLKPEEAVRHEFITGHKATTIPRTSQRDGSPVRRSAPVAAPRPLPDPPASIKMGPSTRLRDPIRVSPHKPTTSTASTARRISGVANGNPTSGPGHMKRLSMGPAASIPSSISNLPRPGANRSVSSTLASAGAAAAMSRRN